MPYITPRPNETWEIRESHGTPDGPRSKTLATFRTLTPEVVSRARERSQGPVDEMELRRAARRAGAPVTPPAADRAAGELLAELESGRRPRPTIERALLGALGASGAEPLHAAQAAAAWIGATPRQRGEALRDLLLLVDSLPPRALRTRERFPRIESSKA